MKSFQLWEVNYDEYIPFSLSFPMSRRMVVAARSKNEAKEGFRTTPGMRNANIRSVSRVDRYTRNDETGLCDACLKCGGNLHYRSH